MIRFNIATNGFYGIYHEAINSKDSKKVVIVLGGSEGNERIPLYVGEMFAQRGIAALGICYWNVEGLPASLINVPLDPFEKAIGWLKEKGFEKIYIYGISKGAELALLCASLIPEINGVIALSPSHCIWGGIKGNGNLFSKAFTKQSEFTWKGKAFPCMVAKVKYGPVIKNLIKERQMNMTCLYETPLQNFDEQSAIPVEKIKGNILFIYPTYDTMWPSKLSVEYMVKRLQDKNWPYKVEQLEYEKASHIMVPLHPSKLKMFKVERQFPEECKNNRLEAFEKTIKWVGEQ